MKTTLEYPQPPLLTHPAARVAPRIIPRTLARNALLALGTLVPVGLYLSWLNRFAVNVPQWDDFAVLATVGALRQCSTWVEWTKHLFAFHNEHRLVYTRLVAWLASGWAGGPVDFRLLMAWGNASLLGLLGLFGTGVQRANLPTLAWLPVPFLVLHLQFFENTFFAMAALQNLTVWLWAGLALACLSRPTGPYFGLALGLGLLATGTSGNGLLVFPAGALVLMGQKRYALAGLWLGCFALAVSLYTRGLPTGPPFTDPTSFVRAFLGYLGALGGARFGAWTPALVGLALVLVVTGAGLVLRRRHGPALWTRPEGTWLALFGFVALTGAAIALRRPVADVLSVPRYKIGSVVAVVLAYLLVSAALPRSVQQRRWAAFVVAGSVLFWAVSYRRITPHVLAQRLVLLQDAADFERSGRLRNPAYRAQGFAPELHWRAAVEAGLYRFPTHPDEPKLLVFNAGSPK
jgi:hypothetical protein